MKERPILFNGRMVLSILAGFKTQTRRVAPIADLNIKPNSDDLVTWGVSFTKPVKGVLGSHSGGRFSDLQARSIIASQFNPYGQPGDRLWVREAHALDDKRVFYRAGHEEADGSGPRVDVRWRPSIHMPRWASRITLEVTGVRVERLQDISEADCIAEGIEKTGSGFWSLYGEADVDGTYSPCASYRALWSSINGAESWDQNAWVWVIEFQRI